MFFKRCDRKRRNPYVTIALISLAAAGAISTVNMGKRFIMDKMCCMKKIFKCADMQKCTDSQKPQEKENS